MRILTYCDAKITSTRATAGQFKGQFKGALVERSIGKGRRRAHLVPGSLIRVDIGVGQRRRAPDVESPALPAKRTSV